MISRLESQELGRGKDLQWQDKAASSIIEAIGNRIEFRIMLRLFSGD